MNFRKLVSGLASAAVLSSLLLSGCASEKTITTENAPNEIMKNLAAISKDSTTTEVTSALAAAISKTADFYNYQLEFKTEGKGNTLDLEDGSIKTKPMETSSVDYRAAMGNTVYEFLDQDIAGKKQTGLMKADAEAIITAYADVKSGSPEQKSMDLTYISSDKTTQQMKYSEDEIKDVVKNTVMIPMFSDLGADLIISPVSLPEYYDYSLVQKGNSYTFTLKINDLDKYNDYLEQYNKDTFGVSRTDLKRDGSLIAEEYTTDRLEISMTMNEEGVISSFTNSNYSKISSGENETDDVYLDQTITIGHCPAALPDSMASFFDKLAKDDIKEGETFTLSFDETAKTESSEKDEPEKDESKTETSEKDDAKAEDKKDEGK